MVEELKRKYTKAIKRGSEFVPAIVIGNQRFDMDYSGSSTEVEWCRKMLAKAIGKIIEQEQGATVQEPEKPKKTPVSSTEKCSACGREFGDHPGIIATCRELQGAKAKLDAIRKLSETKVKA